MRHILLNSAVAVVAATLGTAAIAGDATKDKDHLTDRSATTQPVEIRVEGDIDENALPAGGTIDVDERDGTVDTGRMNGTMDNRDDAIKARGEIDAQQNKADYKKDKSEYKSDLRHTDKDRTVRSDGRMDQDGQMRVSGEIDTDRAQTAGAFQEGDRSTESKPRGSDKEHLKVHNPEKPHLSDK
jgi:hypothetical protein